ncbi:MAG TPA: hypothetical protein VGO23_10410 [Pseudonocardia sp.]|nr:hypothetical protein [Pseudonocardia sp.]
MRRPLGCRRRAGIAGARRRAGLRRRCGHGVRSRVAELLSTVLSAPDPFSTAALRDAVLGAWAASPTRFREDANAEEDLLLGGYAEAWFVELAQNAADAARAAGRPGRLRVSLTDGELRVANTGAPLDAAGVAALASLRASAKRDDHGSVGRFGVGFAAVVPVSPEPRIVAADGRGVRFSATRTAEEVAGLPGPAAELARRAGQLPVLRLVWPVDEDEPAPPDGYETEVRLPLRPGTDGEALLAEARAAAPDLLLALPDLAEIAVGETVLARTDDGDVATVGGRRWRLARRSGALDEATADTAVEQRERRTWSVCWALPLDGPLPAGEVLHAPTASGERLTLPARLIATLPLEPDRRRVRPGPLTDALVREAGAAYLDLVESVPPAERTLLVPGPGFPASPLDGLLREALLDVLRDGAWLPGAAGPALAPRRAEWLDVPGAEGLPALLAAADPAFERLVDVPEAGPAALQELGVTRVPAAELTERLLRVERPDTWWRDLYAALEPAAETVPGLAEELRALPVPLADGRLAAGAASVLLAEPDADPAVRTVAELGLPGLHVAAPEAVHPLLARLGAGAADPASLLEHPAVRDAVDRSLDDADAGLDPEPLAAAVLGLLGATGDRVAGTGALALPDSEGNPARADELMLPDAALAPLLDPDAPVGVLDGRWATRIPREAFVAAGVLDGFAVVVDEEPVGPDHELHDEDLWWDSLEGGPARVVAVRDLDLVADDAWPAALRLLAAEPDTRAAVLRSGGYTGWWLARNALLGGRAPAYWRLPSASALAGFYDPVPDTGIDETLLAAIGVRAGLVVRSTDDAADLLARLGDPARTPDAGLALAAHAALADALVEELVDVDRLELPERVRSLAGGVVAVDDAVVLDAPWTAAVLPAGELVGGGDPAALAELLDLPLSSDVVAAEIVGEGEPVAWSALPEVLVVCHTLGVDVPAGELRRHEDLRIRLRRPEQGVRSVPAWPDAGGRWHAADPVRALLASLADHAASPTDG